MKTLVMSPAAHIAMAIRWALIGFAASGRGFNGDNYDREKYPSVESMLVDYFEGLYDRLRQPADKDTRDITRAARRAARGDEGAE